MTLSNDLPNPLGVTIALNDKQTTMVTQIEEYDLWFVREKLSIDALLPVEAIPDAILEFKRYMALVALGYEFLLVPNKAVDEVWHTFILFTRKYQSFCEDIVGWFIHHDPITSRTPVPEAARQDWVSAYNNVFGSNQIYATASSNMAKCCSGSCRGMTNRLQ